MKIKFTRFFPLGGGQVMRQCVVEWPDNTPLPNGAEMTDDDLTDGWADANGDEPAAAQETAQEDK